MPSYRAPGVFVEEISSGSRPIAPVGTSTAAFIGVAQRGPVNTATLITSFAEFGKQFGGPYRILEGTSEHYLYYSVRHFFEQGGSRCYVVRIVHYSNVEVASSIQASAATRDFDGTLPNGNPVSPALTVTAISPGLWGQELEARVISSSKFSLRLAADIAAGNATQVSLVLNDQVQVGSLLWLVEEVVGRIQTIDTATGAVTFEGPLAAGGANFTGQIAQNRPVYGPGFSYFGTTSQGAAIPVANGVPTPANGIIVNPVAKVDGTNLRPGDTLTFAITEARVVVSRVSVQSATPVTSIAHFAAQTLPAFAATRTRVYARDFTLFARRQGVILETHENLSLVNTNATDHVDIRLGAASGASQYVTASDQTDTNDLAVINNSAFLGLQGGSDGLPVQDADFLGSETLKTGLNALTPIRDAAILVVPNASEAVTKGAIAYAEKRGDLFLIVEKPSSSTDKIEAYRAKLSSKYAAIYHPRIQVTDEVTGRPVLVPPSGAIAGIFALTDSKRGVHKAPAGLDTGKVVVATGVETTLTKAEYDVLYPLAINAILKLRDGIHVWGSRTLSADPEWLQINIRRLFNFLEKSIENGTQWVTFEPNGPPLWKSIERNIREFLRIQWREGKLVGTTEKDAFFVNCNAETNPPEVVDAGQVVTVIGVAPSRPAEFVIFRIRQKVGQSAG